MINEMEMVSGVSLREATSEVLTSAEVGFEPLTFHDTTPYLTSQMV